MLNFDNARTVTSKMLVASRNYVEMVIQKTLDHGISFDENDPEALVYAVETGSDIPTALAGALNEEEGNVFDEFFDSLHSFEVCYNCHGVITFEIGKEDYKNSTLFRLISEILLENGFKPHKRDNGYTYYTICLKDIPYEN